MNAYSLNLVYTGLFDIGRDRFDGRSFNQYKKWLTDTINLFPGINIFHDGSLNDFSNLDCNLISVQLSELTTFSYHNNVFKILQNFQPVSKYDITFQTPLYSLIQFSKFELASKLKVMTNCNSALWVDAGISRFVNSIDYGLLKKNMDKLIKKKKVAAFEIDLKRNLNLKQLSIKNPRVGTCKRVISGASFWMNANFIDDINRLINIKIDDWISKNIWDNEQIMLRILLGENQFNIEYIRQKQNPPGSVARNLGSTHTSNNEFANRVINHLLRL